MSLAAELYEAVKRSLAGLWCNERIFAGRFAIVRPLAATLRSIRDSDHS